MVFIPFAVFVIVGSSNAVNLTDGLDGLATVPVILVAVCFAFISYVAGNIVFSDYLQIPYIEGTGEISIFCGAIIGACLGFLWFNAPPAKIFMGDTGSLSLGGSLGAVGIITKARNSFSNNWWTICFRGGFSNGSSYFFQINWKKNI